MSRGAAVPAVGPPGILPGAGRLWQAGRLPAPQTRCPRPNLRCQYERLSDFTQRDFFRRFGQRASEAFDRFAKRFYA
jgi:hypothetical protein